MLRVTLARPRDFGMLGLPVSGMEATSRRSPAHHFALRRARDLQGSYGLRVVALAASYYCAAQIGYAFDFSGPVAAIVWLPAGVGIAFLYLSGLTLWPGVLIGDLLVNDYSALPLGSAVGQTCGNVLEVLIAAALMRRFARGGGPLDSVTSLSRMLIALATGTAVSATVGGLSLL